MKKIILSLLMLAGTTATFASAENNYTTRNNSVELTSNMELVPLGQKPNLNKALRVIDLGVCDVYVNGEYIGTYHVYLVTR